MEIPADMIDRIRGARHICVLTGAGISAESGVPTFRDAQTGLWTQYRPEELASADAFLRDPELVWRWYRWRRELISKANVNAAHLALARLEKLVADFTLVTQNVDGLHQRAGSDHVIEFHGNIFVNRFFKEGAEVECDDSEPVPTCPDCGGPVRPGVVWFGETIPPSALNAALAAASDCDFFLSVGTSSLVYPAAGLAELAQGSGAAVAEINPQSTDLAHTYEFAIQEPAGVALPALVASMVSE